MTRHDLPEGRCGEAKNPRGTGMILGCLILLTSEIKIDSTFGSFTMRSNISPL
jgi:hypothetical protein